MYVPDYVTVIRVLGSGTNEGLSPRSGCGRPPSLVPTHPHRTRGVKLVGARVVTLGCGGISVVPFCDVLRHGVLTHNLLDFLVLGAM